MDATIEEFTRQWIEYQRLTRESQAGGFFWFGQPEKAIQPSPPEVTQPVESVQQPSLDILPQVVKLARLLLKVTAKECEKELEESSLGGKVTSLITKGAIESSRLSDDEKEVCEVVRDIFLVYRRINKERDN